ncbi:HdeD family acid-resistance protein [Protaetiibacter mangrovi]|uniref:DUF308 domain-containing protein n=2 Tax=Microbacteriaceae TaxID=85023 RepID=A0ABT1ZIL6_9MICO|nr:DUF308 domain-containing protein [Protaetiibacter mangrovi]MCS0500557.1 DUF308 domain-containing protein [Protaetiibacter mangrovi]TPX04474.1 HdeD family acid-resistance protein [Schumannella luteola]
MSNDDVIEVSRFIKSVWWLVLLRGIFAIILGVLAFVAPVLTAIVFVWVFAFYAIVDGVVNIMHAISVRKSDPTWGWLLTIGIVGVLAGIGVAIFPAAAGALALLVLLWIVAIWAVIGGIFGIPAAAALASGGAKAMGIIFSVVSILFGIVLMVMLFTTPQSALIGLIYVLGAWAVIAGIVLIIIAFQARSAANANLAAA